MHLECLIVSLIFGITPIMTKYILGFISIETYLFLMSVWTVIFGIVFFLTNEAICTRDIKQMNQQPYLHGIVFIISAMIFIVADYFYFKLLTNNKAYLVTAIVAAYPLFTALFGNLLMNESITYSHLLGIFLIVCGVFFLSA
jgi:drug/metabolite transporter (DMT)-like permease